MKLSKLSKHYPESTVYGEAEIEGIFSSSKKKSKNWLFVCNERDKKKMKKYLDEAVINGAAAALVPERCESSLPQIVANDIRSAYSYIAAAFYGDPQKDLKIVGVVGTNGKTTTCRLIYEILNRCGEPCGNVGTLGAFFMGEKKELDLTTPDPEDFFSVLAEMRDRGVRTVVTELSAHAIFYKKLDCVFFEALIFTNCTQDHLDFFRNMESYSKVKTSIFTDDKCLYKVINADDEYGRAIIDKGESNVVSYGVKNPAEVFALKIRIKADGTSFFVNAFDSVERVQLKLLGAFNVYNSLAAITFCALKGIDLTSCLAALSKVEAVEGRLERVATISGADIFIDYAHTPDGLENALLTLSKITKNSLICLFGCGGNRDKEKRAVMGRVAGDIADFVVVTSDNPRYEDPDLIIGEIVKGVREATLDYITISDREQAIRYAISLLSKGDVLLIAGKGAEEYQEVMGVKREFSDKKVVLKEIGAV